MTEPLEWRRSKHCSGGNCVEVAKAGDRYLIRDSTRPATALSFTAGEWAAFVRGIKTDGFFSE